MRIGVLGGTFDPIHNAHLQMGELALSNLNLDKVLFMPAGNPYFKSEDRNISLPIHRANMTKIAIAPFPDFEFADIELKRNGYTYTIDTIKELKTIYPNDELYFIFGADSFMQISFWYKPREIFKNVKIAVVSRNEAVNDIQLDKQIKKYKFKYGAKITKLIFDCDNISSTSIRNSLIKKDADNLISLPTAVLTYIKNNGLYALPNKEQIKSRISIELNKHRYLHSIGVANTAYDLALCHGYKEPDKAYLTGLLHDIGKPYADALSHAAVGAEIANKTYNIDDKEILTAIRSHTIGSTSMSVLDKIIYLADFIEPGREKFKELELIRTLSYVDLDRAMLSAIESTFDYLKTEGRTIDEKSYLVYNYFNELLKGNKNE